MMWTLSQRQILLWNEKKKKSDMDMGKLPVFKTAALSIVFMQVKVFVWCTAVLHKHSAYICAFCIVQFIK